MKAAAFLCFSLTTALLGQSGQTAPEPKPKFEVASVKATRAENAGGRKITPFRFICSGCRLDELILSSYAQRSFAVQGLPSWANNAFYDIKASLEPQGPAPLSKQENFKLVMAALRSLLEDRFHLQFHHEKQLRPGFRLVTAKGGLKLKPQPNRSAGTSYTARTIDGRRVIEYRNYTMANVAGALASELQRQVVDATGAEGRYDLKIQMDPGEPREPVSLAAALGNFGLRLEAEKLEADIFVIDHLERPSGN